MYNNTKFIYKEQFQEFVWPRMETILFYSTEQMRKKITVIETPVMKKDKQARHCSTHFWSQHAGAAEAGGSTSVEDNLVYTVSSKSASVTEWDPVSKNRIQTKNQRKTEIHH